jgi:protein TonB
VPRPAPAVSAPPDRAEAEPAPLVAPASEGSGAPGPGPQTPALRGGTQRRPHYPRAARLRGVEGVTLLRVQVAASGHVAAVEVERSAGDADLDRAAAVAIRTWRFEPFGDSRDPSILTVLVPVEFRLR